MLHDHDPVGDGEDQLHVVLAEQDGETQVLREAVDEVDGHGRLLGGHARRGLVHDQELRAVSQGDRHLEHLLVPVGERTAHPPGLVRQADVPEDLPGLLDAVSLRRREELVRLLMVEEHDHLNVLEDRNPLEDVHRLEGEADPESLFTEVSGIGEKMASRIAEKLDIYSLEELEQAAHDGRLEEVEGFGKRRVRGVKSALAGMLSRSARRRARSGGEGEQDRPPVSLLLETDKEYREKAYNDELRKIAPKRFNPEGKKWLPIMETGRKGWKMTALFSNTKRAHELGKTDQWVVIYYEKVDNEGQATVVNGRRGELRGRRVVRGREKECREYYRNKN